MRRQEKPLARLHRMRWASRGSHLSHSRVSSRRVIAAAVAGRGLPVLDCVSRLIWSGEVKGWDEGDHLARASEEAGLDLATLDGQIEADPDHFDSLIEANQAAHADAGHWGVPTMAFEGEAFFGQDRLSHLIWRLEQNGLTKRPPAISPTPETGAGSA